MMRMGKAKLNTFYYGQNHTNPKKPQSSPHHSKEEIRSPCNGTKCTRIIPSDCVPKVFHHPTCAKLQTGAQNHSNKKNNKVMCVIKPIQKQGKNYGPYPINRRKRTPHKTCSAFPSAIYHQMKNIF